MSDLWDKLKSELDRAGKVAQEALDEGKLRIQLFRIRQAADKSAQALGYAIYRARKDGHEPDSENYSRLMKELAEQDAEMSRIELELRNIDASDGSPPPPAPPPAQDGAATS